MKRRCLAFSHGDPSLGRLNVHVWVANNPIVCVARGGMGGFALDTPRV